MRVKTVVCVYASALSAYAKNAWKLYVRRLRSYRSDTQFWKNFGYSTIVPFQTNNSDRPGQWACVVTTEDNVVSERVMSESVSEGKGNCSEMLRIFFKQTDSPGISDRSRLRRCLCQYRLG